MCYICVCDKPADFTLFVFGLCCCTSCARKTFNCINVALRKHEFTLCFTIAHAASIATPARVATSAMKSFTKTPLTPEAFKDGECCDYKDE